MFVCVCCMFVHKPLDQENLIYERIVLFILIFKSLPLLPLSNCDCMYVSILYKSCDSICIQFCIFNQNWSQIAVLWPIFHDVIRDTLTKNFQMYHLFYRHYKDLPFYLSKILKRHTIKFRFIDLNYLWPEVVGFRPVLDVRDITQIFCKQTNFG